MSLSRIAKRYAEALFQLACDRNILEDAFQKIEELRLCFVASHDLKLFIRNSVLTKEQKIQVLTAIFHGRLNDFIINFLLFLVEKNRLNQIEEICGFFGDCYRRKNNIAIVRIESAFAVEHAQVEKIAQQLSKAYNVKIQPEVLVNTDLIGGVKLKIEDILYDASFKTQLQNFHQSIGHI